MTNNLSAITIRPEYQQLLEELGYGFSDKTNLYYTFTNWETGWNVNICQAASRHVSRVSISHYTTGGQSFTEVEVKPDYTLAQLVDILDGFGIGAYAHLRRKKLNALLD